MIASLFTWALVLFAAPSSLYDSASGKIQIIVNDKAPRGAVYHFSEAELNAYVRGELPAAAPEGIRDPKIRLQQGGAVATALVDFLKLERRHGRNSGWLMRKILEGEHVVKATVRLSARNGMCRVDITEAYLDRIPLPGSALELLIEMVILPQMPNVKVGEPFPMQHNVERIDVAPGGVKVSIRG